MKTKIKIIQKVSLCIIALFILGGFLFIPNLAQALTAGPVGHDIRFDVQIPNLVATLDANPRRARINTVVTYTMRVTNSATALAAATNTNAICPIPNYTSYVAGSITGTGADDSNPNILAWNIGNLNIGQSVTMTFKVLTSTATPNNTTVSTQGQIFCDELFPTLTSDPQNSTPFSPTPITIYRDVVPPGGTVIPPDTGASILQALLALFLTTFIARKIYRHRQRVKDKPAVVLN